MISTGGDIVSRLVRVEDAVTGIREVQTRNSTLLEINAKLLEDQVRKTDIMEKHMAGLAAEARIVRWLAVVIGLAVATLQMLQLMHVVT